MKRHSSRHAYLLPFTPWGELATKTMETMLASAQVISHRTSRMALAGPVPSERDRREFALMGQEKIEAGMQSAQAITAHLMTIAPRLGALAMSHLLRTSAAFMALAGSQTPAQFVARQAALTHALGQSAVGMAEASTSASRLAHRGLKPIHAAATANARRLRKP